jgi:ketosteroid isomerase-like protein
LQPVVAWLVVAVVGSVAAGATEPVEELRATETAFAATMANRDLAAFTAFLDNETVFYSGPTELRGKRAVAEAWAKFFDGEAAPFSWRPEIASVLDSGELGLTSGPVFDPQGERVGTFISTWRRAPDGSWKIVFDLGCP